MRSVALVPLFAALVLAAPGVSLLTKRDTCTNGAITVESQSCQVRCNTDMAGGNERTVLQTTLQSCAEACALDPSCIVAQRDASNGNCYLKLQTTLLATKQGIDTLLCPASCSEGSRVISGRLCTTHCGKDRNGPSYGQVSGINVVDCANKCAADARCQYATFWSGNCYLKEQMYNLTDNINVNAVDCVAAA